jgi:hypothetical protein
MSDQISQGLFTVAYYVGFALVFLAAAVAVAAAVIAWQTRQRRRQVAPRAWTGQWPTPPLPDEAYEFRATARDVRGRR